MKLRANLNSQFRRCEVSMRSAHVLKALEWRKKLVDQSVLNLLRVNGEVIRRPGVFVRITRRSCRL